MYLLQYKKTFMRCSMRRFKFWNAFWGHFVLGSLFTLLNIFLNNILALSVCLLVYITSYFGSGWYLKFLNGICSGIFPLRAHDPWIFTNFCYGGKIQNDHRNTCFKHCSIFLSLHILRDQDSFRWSMMTRRKTIFQK